MARNAKKVKKVKAKKPVRAKRAVKARRPTRTARPKKTPADPLHEPPGHSELEDAGPKDEVWEIFRRYDTDRNGYIDQRELSYVCEALGMSIGDDELAIAFDAIDTNRSGKISWDEFSAWWRSR